MTVNGSSDLAHIPDAVVKENGHIDVPLTAQLNNPSSASEALTVVVSGLPGSNVGTITPHDGGVYDAAAGTITYTLVPGASLNTTIGFTPYNDSDVDFGTLTVTATATGCGQHRHRSPQAGTLLRDDGRGCGSTDDRGGRLRSDEQGHTVGAEHQRQR